MACAGVTIKPGDILVGDADGVVVLPPAIAAEVLADAREQERQEEFITGRVAEGEPIDGLYPLTDAPAPPTKPGSPSSHPPPPTHLPPLIRPPSNAQRCDIDAVITATMSHRAGDPDPSHDAPDAPDAGEAK